MYKRFSVAVSLSIAFVISLQMGLSVGQGRDEVRRVYPRAKPGQRTAPGLLMESMFSPHLAPPHKTMGLAQRSFLDVIEEVDTRLELALVVDATDSMSDCLDDMKSAVKKMAQNLNRFVGDQVAFQLVVYRDSAAGPGKVVSYPLNVHDNGFVSDVEQLSKALDNVKTESGAPYFHELVDLGLHHAITKLNWSKAADTDRWIMLFGDAPPYASGFRDEESGAQREVETDQLISLATQANIHVHCVLCTSRGTETDAYEAALPEMREFMGAISTRTGGLLVDLSYDDIRSAIESTMIEPRVEYQAIEPITQDNVESMRRNLQLSAKASRRTRVAVLPHLPLAKMSFDSRLPEVMVAAELRQKFRKIEHADVKSASSVRQVFMALRGRVLGEAKLLRTLANGLKVDYIVWGQLQQLPGDSGTIEITSGIYDRASGARVVRRSDKSNIRVNPAKNITNQLAKGLIQAAAASGNVDPKLAQAFRVPDRTVAQMIRPVATTATTRDQILTGFDLLEQALTFKVGEAGGSKLLAKAEAELRKATRSDPRNAMAHHLLANCYFNQAMALHSAGDTEAAKKRMKGCTGSLTLAKQGMSRADENTRLEIQADYELYLGDDGEAISYYEKLLPAEDSQSRNLHMALRAHWMLAGIRSGDFDVDAQYIDHAKAREHLLYILAAWPNSHEASLIRQNLRWNDAAGKTKHNHVPRERAGVTRLIES